MVKGTSKATTKLKQLKLVDGKATPDSGQFANIKTIDDILGTKPQGPFKSKSVAEFEASIDKEMNLADMQSLASRVGLLPIHDRPLLKKRLIEEFKRDLRKKVGYGEIDSVASNENLNEAVSEKARRILKQGQ